MVDILFNKDRCKGCGLCIKACPKNILFLETSKTNEKGYNPAEIMDKELCIGCCSCALTCPDLCIEIKKEKQI